METNNITQQDDNMDTRTYWVDLLPGLLAIIKQNGRGQATKDANAQLNKMAGEADLLADFPNGFDSWQETHFEIVTWLQENVEKEGTLPHSIMETQGTGGLYAVARSLTNEFERQHVGIEWNGDFFDVIEEWLNKQNIFA